MQIKSLISDFTSHWKSPAEGNFISNKEVASYSAGGIGPYTINALFGQYVVLASTCFLIGSAYGIKPMDLAFLSVLMGVLNLVKTPFVSMLLDNTKSSLGKFRPYLIYTGVPTVCLLTFMAFIPLDFSYRGKLLLIGAAYALLMLFQSLFQTAYDSLGQVMTPNEKERTSLLSVSAFVGNLGPSILGALIPILANF
ncbi:MAG: MFS transporter, partial [Oscillospiraceae bacterium]|nr:MFS transporter [Oscillospiraceae bacterium]